MVSPLGPSRGARGAFSCTGRLQKKKVPRENFLQHLKIYIVFVYPVHTAEPIYAETSLAGVASHRGCGWRPKNGDFLKIMFFLYSLCIPKTTSKRHCALTGSPQPPRLRLAPPRQPRGRVCKFLDTPPPSRLIVFFLTFFVLLFAST